jgi:hypothetical protein
MLQIPPATPPGDYFIIAAADDLAVVSELSDSNNAAVSEQPLTVTLPGVEVSASAHTAHRRHRPDVRVVRARLTSA